MENNEKNEIALNTTIRRVVKLSIVVLFSQKWSIIVCHSCVRVGFRVVVLTLEHHITQVKSFLGEDFNFSDLHIFSLNVIPRNVVCYLKPGGYPKSPVKVSDFGYPPDFELTHFETKKIPEFPLWHSFSEGTESKSLEKYTFLTKFVVFVDSLHRIHKQQRDHDWKH